MENRFTRTEKLIGIEALQKLQNTSIAIFGVGGVGGYVAEALVRAGIGSLSIIDNDTVDITNINRQIIALTSTIGRYKVDVLEERILDINPLCKVTCYNKFVTAENISEYNIENYDAVVDAVDNVTAKLAIAELCYKLGVPLISSMGTGNKLDPTKFQIGDIYDTTVCPLSRVMRKELKCRNIPSLRVLYSTEKPLLNERPPSSISFLPSVAGLLIAADLINNIIP